LAGLKPLDEPADAPLPETRLDPLVELVNPKRHWAELTGRGRMRQSGGRGIILSGI
jgi:hypothetical protein